MKRYKNNLGEWFNYGNKNGLCLIARGQFLFREGVKIWNGKFEKIIFSISREGNAYKR